MTRLKMLTVNLIPGHLGAMGVPPARRRAEMQQTAKR